MNHPEEILRLKNICTPNLSSDLLNQVGFRDLARLLEKIPPKITVQIEFFDREFL